MIESMQSDHFRDGGTFSHVTRSAAAAVDYFQSHARLIGVEAKEAATQYGLAVAMVAGGLFVALLAYILLLMTAVFGIASLFESRTAWIPVLGVAALLHVAGAVALVLVARRYFQTSPFRDSLKELK